MNKVSEFWFALGAIGGWLVVLGVAFLLLWTAWDWLCERIVRRGLRQ